MADMHVKGLWEMELFCLRIKLRLSPQQMRSLEQLPLSPKTKECITTVEVFFPLSGQISTDVVEIPKFLVRSFFSMLVKILSIPG